MTYTPARRRRRLIIVLVVTFVVTSLVGGFLWLNLALVPRAVTRAAALADSAGASLEAGRAWYLPFVGFVIRDIGLRSGPAGRDLKIDGADVPVLTVSRVRARLPWGVYRFLRNGAAAIQSASRESESTRAPDDPGLYERIMHALSDATAARLLPGRVVVRDAAVAFPTANRAVSLRSTRIVLASDARGGIVTASSSGSEDDLRGSIRINYIDGVADARIEPTVISAGPVSSVRLAGRLTLERVGDSQSGAPGGGDGPTAAFDEPGDIAFSADLHASNLTVDLPALAEESVQVAEIGYGFAGSLHRTGGEAMSVTFTRGELSINGVGLSLQPTILGSPRDPRLVRVGIDLSGASISEIADAIPQALLGPLSGLQISGTLSWDLDLVVPLDGSSDVEWDSQATPSGLAVTAIPAAVNVYKLNDAFVHTIVDEEIGFRRTIAIPPARPASMDWMLTHSEHSRRRILASRAADAAKRAERPPVTVLPPVSSGQPSADDMAPATAGTGRTGATANPDPAFNYVFVDDMSPWIIRATLTAEDGDFFFYGGVNPVTLADAIEINIREGGIAYGASTISMQLVKMLFLDHARIFSRKLQEVLLVYLMEHEVPVSKERILELYLNLAEYGPGIFGISDAAAHYFGKHPLDLTAEEATWLASILPSPKINSEQLLNGRVSDESFARMLELYAIMLERGRMTEEEYAAAVSTRPAFRARR